MFTRRWIVPLSTGTITIGSFVAMLAWSGRVPVFFVLFGMASMAYLIAVWHCERMPLAAIVIAGIAFRVIMLFATPALSDDIYRYAWDGRVQWAGINPYRFAPVAAELAHLRDARIYPNINHPDLPTIYPPGAQVAFWLGYGMSGGIAGIKALLACADLIAGWLLVRLLGHFNQRPQWVLIYLWHPLVVVEIAGNGHLESLGIVALLAALYFFVKGRERLAAVALAGGVLAKFFPLVLLPVFARWKGWRPTNWPALLIAPGVVILGYLPFAWTGAPVFGSLGTYAQHWSFNSAAFDVLMLLCGDGQLARGIIAALFVGIALWLSWRRVSALRHAYLIVAAFVLLTPTLHAWYAVWLIPFLAFYRQPALIAFSLLVVLSYHVLIPYRAGGAWEEAPWVQWVEFGGAALVGIAAWHFKRREILTKIRHFFKLNRSARRSA